ncbi:hypothetical protein ERJ75_000431900 [Trypanosoma vivax]|nr:hypothetical protein TRVL_04597 [Trypanosoma vivax]KAH8616964.1 hypothetical protein ERJ75_000431900 [Trypanosoma vivax]
MAKSPNEPLSDAQLDVARAFPEPDTLLQVMLEHFHKMERDNTDPFAMRIVFAGRRKEDTLYRPSLVMEKVLKKTIDSSTNPLNENNDVVIMPSGLIIDFEDHFIALLEGIERHITGFLINLHSDYAMDDNAAYTDIRILFLSDDVSPSGESHMCFVDKLPTSMARNEIQEVSDGELADMIAKDVNKLTNFLTLALEETTKKRSAFLDNARISHPVLFPSLSTVKMYVKRDICLSLDEYVRVFGQLPELNKDIEMVHPIDEPMKH